MIGFGVQPVTDYFEGAALNDDGSISVDSCLRVVEGVCAAGDIARFPLRGDGDPSSGGALARRRAAWPGGGDEYAGAEQTIRCCSGVLDDPISQTSRLYGHATDWDDIVVHGDLNKPEFLAYSVKNGVVAAAAGLDRGQGHRGADRTADASPELDTIGVGR